AVLLGESGEQIRLLRQLMHFGDLAVDPTFYTLLNRHNLIQFRHGDSSGTVLVGRIISAFRNKANLDLNTSVDRVLAVTRRSRECKVRDAAAPQERQKTVRPLAIRNPQSTIFYCAPHSIRRSFTTLAYGCSAISNSSSEVSACAMACLRSPAPSSA